MGKVNFVLRDRRRQGLDYRISAKNPWNDALRRVLRRIYSVNDNKGFRIVARILHLPIAFRFGCRVRVDRQKAKRRSSRSQTRAEVRKQGFMWRSLGVVRRFEPFERTPTRPE